MRELSVSITTGDLKNARASSDIDCAIARGLHRALVGTGFTLKTCGYTIAIIQKDGKLQSVNLPKISQHLQSKLFRSEKTEPIDFLVSIPDDEETQ